MSIARLDGRMQVCCDNCPASYPNTYKVEDFTVMIADAKASGWTIRKAMPSRDSDTTELFRAPPRIAGGKREDPYTHACPDCGARDSTAKLF